MEVAFELHKAQEDLTTMFLALSGFPFNVHFSRTIAKMDIKSDLCLLILNWYDNDYVVSLQCSSKLEVLVAPRTWMISPEFYQIRSLMGPHRSWTVCTYRFSTINGAFTFPCAHTAVVVLVRHFLHTLFHCEWYALVACQFCKGGMRLWNYWWLCLTRRLCWLAFLDKLIVCDVLLLFVYYVLHLFLW